MSFHLPQFKCNPFRALSFDEWADVAVLHPQLAPLANHAAHLQIIGRKGRGKTSALLALADLLTQSGKSVCYERLPIGQMHFTSQFDAVDVFLLDEAQRLSFSERRRLFKLPVNRFVIGTHITYLPWFVLNGLPLKTIKLSQQSRHERVAHLTSMIEQRLTYFSASEASLPLSDDAYIWLIRRFGDDYRAIEWFLYDVFQTWPGDHNISADDLQAHH